ncbi:hypothetical protein ABZP36_034612 [Zizania latifolia]
MEGLATTVAVSVSPAEVARCATLRDPIVAQTVGMSATAGTDIAPIGGALYCTSEEDVISSNLGLLFRSSPQVSCGKDPMLDELFAASLGASPGGLPSSHLSLLPILPSLRLAVCSSIDVLRVSPLAPTPSPDSSSPVQVLLESEMLSESAPSQPSTL